MIIVSTVLVPKVYQSLNAVNTHVSNTRCWINVSVILSQCCTQWMAVNQHFFRLGPLRTLSEFPFIWTSICLEGGGPGVVVSTAAFHARVRGSVPGLGGLKETKNVSSPSTCESQYCGEPPWPRGSVLGLRPSGLEFWILCLEDSVISFISPSLGGSPGPV